MSDAMMAAIVSTLVSAIVSALVSFWVLHLSHKNETKRSIDNELSEILKIGIEHPYFELERFTSQWSPEKPNSDTQYAAYDLYATLVFNHLEKRCKFNCYKFDKVQNEIDMWSWVKLHKEYWKRPCATCENVLGYDKRFSSIVEFIIKGKGE